MLRSYLNTIFVSFLILGIVLPWKQCLGQEINLTEPTYGYFTYDKFNNGLYILSWDFPGGVSYYNLDSNSIVGAGFNRYLPSLFNSKNECVYQSQIDLTVYIIWRDLNTGEEGELLRFEFENMPKEKNLRKSPFDGEL